MPLPQLQPNQEENDYINSCMSALKNEKIPEKQKLAQCYSQYRRAQKRAKGKEVKWEDINGGDIFALY